MPNDSTNQVRISTTNPHAYPLVQDGNTLFVNVSDQLFTDRYEQQQ